MIFSSQLFTNNLHYLLSSQTEVFLLRDTPRVQPNYSEAEHPAQEKTDRRQKAKNDHIKIRKYKNTHQNMSNNFYSTDSTTHLFRQLLLATIVPAAGRTAAGWSSKWEDFNRAHMWLNWCPCHVFGESPRFLIFFSWHPYGERGVQLPQLRRKLWLHMCY